MIAKATPSLTRKQTARFYEPLIIYEALFEACKTESTEPNDNERESNPIQLTERDRFHKFVYKLAYICAFDKGPDTVTSFAVLRSNRTNEIKLVFGANQISSVEGLRVSDYLKKVLYIVSQMDRLDVYGKAFVRRAIFKYVFTWNRGRVEAYFKGLTRFLQQCLEHNTECHGKGIKAMVASLQICLPVTFMKGEADLQACVEVVEIINTLKSSDLKNISEQAKGHMAGSQGAKAWSELLHCISRLKAYDQAVNVFVKANEEWPEIFQTDRLIIQHIPSSAKHPNPLGRKSMDVASCIGRMTADLSVMARWRELAENLEKFELNDRIKRQCLKDSFRPVIHSEVLVYDWITTLGEEPEFEFFRGWKYIGSSKPTCKLCDYFFDAVGGNIGRRPCHGNVYVNWRFPEGYGVAPTNKRSRVYFAMNNRIRDDAFKILFEKAATGKSHDSDTYSCWTRQTEAGSKKAGDADLGVTALAQTFAKYLSLDDDDGSVRGEASDHDER